MGVVTNQTFFLRGNRNGHHNMEMDRDVLMTSAIMRCQL